jgi:hypothetical protein
VGNHFREDRIGPPHRDKLHKPRRAKPDREHLLGGEHRESETGYGCAGPRLEWRKGLGWNGAKSGLEWCQVRVGMVPRQGWNGAKAGLEWCQSRAVMVPRQGRNGAKAGPKWCWATVVWSSVRHPF